MVNFKGVLVIASLVASAAAQRIVITQPTALSTVPAGQTFVVNLDRTSSLTASQDVAIAIGIQSCVMLNVAAPGTCDGVNAGGNIGQVLYAGPFNPKRLAGSGRLDLIQKFTVRAPPTLLAGPALVSVAHFGLVGVQGGFCVP